MSKLELYSQNSLPFICRSLDCISEIHATNYIRIRGATNRGLAVF